MTYFPAFDYNLEVLRGNVTGHAMVNIRGHDDSVPNGGPFGLSQDFGGNSYVFNQSAIDRNATPAVVGVASGDANDTSAGSGVRTVRVFGLDASGNAQTNDVSMNGQTAVNTGSTFSAVFQEVTLTTGNGNTNAGIIWVGTGTFTSGVPAVRMLSMKIGFNISLSAYYVVPLGKTLFLRQLIATVGSANKDVQVYIVTSPNGILDFRQIEFGLEGGDLVTDIIALPGLVSGTHVSLLAGGGAASTEVTAILAGELIDN